MQYRKLTELKKLPGNPRIIKDKPFKNLCDSIKENPTYFEARPLILSNRTGELIIIAGNQRYESAKFLKLEEAPTYLMEGLTEAKEKEITIRDNTQQGEWDFDLLSGWDDLPLLDWGMDLPEDWLTPIIPEIIEDAEPQIDKAEELREKWQVETGQLWRLGEHKLICGDCTDKAVVDRLMGGEKASLCLTDPPYATGGKSSDYDISTGELRELISKFLPIANEVSERILLTPGNKHQFLYPEPTWILAWFVQAGVGVNPWGFTFWNSIFAYGKDPYLSRGLGSRPDAFVKTEVSEKVDHSTSKPVGVWLWILERGSIDNGDVIFDPFLGSGTTLIACERLNRKCRAVEIDPGYVAVAIQRWVDATGGAPELIK